MANFIVTVIMDEDENLIGTVTTDHYDRFSDYITGFYCEAKEFGSHYHSMTEASALKKHYQTIDEVILNWKQSDSPKPGSTPAEVSP